MKKLGTVLLAIMMFVSIVSADSSTIYTGSLGEVAWYLMNDAIGTESVADSSGHNYTASMAWDTPESVRTSAYTGSSLNFAGDTMRIWTPANMGATGDFAWSMKIKTTQTTNAGFINHSNDRYSHDSTNQCVGIVNGKVRFSMEGVNWVQTEAAVNDGTWHTVTVVNYWENVCIYVDGQKAALDYAFGEGNNWFPGLATASDSFKYWFGACAWGGYVGEMKDVRIYDYALTDYQIEVINGKTDADPNLVIRYKMDETYAVGEGYFKDSSLSGYNAGIAWDSGATPISHFTGSSFSFENDTVRTFTSKNLPISTRTPFTWAVWVKTTTGGTLFNRCSVNNPWGWDVDGYKQFSLTTSPQFGTAGLPFFSAVGEYPATGTISVADGKWHHVAAAFDGAGTTKIYIDGQFNIAQGQQLQDVNDGDPNFLYMFGTGAGIRYIGEMADLRIYNKELTAEDLAQMAYLGDFDGDRDVDNNDLNLLAEEWLNDYIATPLVVDQVENGNFEAYGASLPLSNNWEEFYYAGTLGSTSNSQFNLITNAADAHTGSQAMTWDYNSIDTSGGNFNFTEIIYYFDNDIANIGDYDQMRVWIKRHAGNSQEGLLYAKFLDYGYDIGNIAAEAWLVKSEGSSYANPDEWYEWSIDLDGMMFGNGYANTSDITDLTGIMFGVSDDGGTGGTGTIDIDDITLVKLVTCSAQKDQDLNNDCRINFEDFVIFARNWLIK